MDPIIDDYMLHIIMFYILGESYNICHFFIKFMSNKYIGQYILSRTCVFSTFFNSALLLLSLNFFLMAMYIQFTRFQKKDYFCTNRLHAIQLFIVRSLYTCCILDFGFWQKQHLLQILLYINLLEVYVHVTQNSSHLFLGTWNN